MKIFCFVLLIACIVATVTGGRYTNKYDNVDLDVVLKSDRLLLNYVNCLLDKGNCTPDGKELKVALPDALATDCRDCSDKHKAGSEKVIRFLVNKRPDLWSKLAEKYDPNNQYRSKFEDVAKKAGIKI
ncbi:allergen Tha p 1-like [Athalia rosae]|uniref:allergen Tha p 1-like n=1 Tax=Athalia rosae TaxID=37344 RepID=UPI002033B4B7|nr:allergen Tha p 1-like [Athalia rosae]